MSGPLFLGVDLGSQSLKLFIVDAELEPVTEANVQFDRDLPQYMTKSGFLHGDGGRVTCPTAMWVEAMDRCFSQLVASGAPLGRVAAISGSAQQHGSVFWRRGALERLQNLNPRKSLTEQLSECFAVSESPVWMDSSTSEHCTNLEDAVGGAEALADVTGSKAYERFTGNQIAKLLAERPADMADCERIGLVSSFLASLLVGGYAAIDASDGSGMNMLDIRRAAWSQPAVAAVAAHHPSSDYNLGSRLGGVVHSHQEVGLVAPFWSRRFGLPASCSVIAFSGDNNNALVGLKLGVRDVAVSLGTSDTIFATLQDATPGCTGHVFAHPIAQGQYMAMLCYSNGSLTREAVRDRAVGRGPDSWKYFDEALTRTQAGNRGQIGFYYDVPEISPQGAQGIFRYGEDDEPQETFSADAEIRAVVESQFLRMRLHGVKLGLEVSEDKRIFVTGGASRSKPMLQILADVFGCPVYRDTKGAVNAAAFGAALRAVHGWKMQRGTTDPAALYAQMLSKRDTAERLVSPDPAAARVYDRMVQRYARLEERTVVACRQRAKL
eukprot:TRINITY_DN10294_c1_g1_i1.p1 TRINITY_DN10294_c1_g1~~TRINITY_DN10294_c1_g1_i1.p1  ORF type:complete len:570 (+),score=192.71 TRINITY_DN10294_c1_g1_i1:58-1710(+)